MSAVEIEALDHVVLRVADLERTLAFYCGALGCTIAKRRDDLGLIHLRAGSAMIDLLPLDGMLGRKGGAAPGTEGRNVDHVALRLKQFDPDALRAHLAAHGIEMGDVAERFGAEGNGPSVYLTDPDGNMVELKGPSNQA
jgi:catechol 2,3-dioxygenase-like lactoylglutathione lyase family enzyme